LEGTKFEGLEKLVNLMGHYNAGLQPVAERLTNLGRCPRLL